MAAAADGDGEEDGDDDDIWSTRQLRSLLGALVYAPGSGSFVDRSWGSRRSISGRQWSLMPGAAQQWRKARTGETPWIDEAEVARDLGRAAL